MLDSVTTYCPSVNVIRLSGSHFWRSSKNDPPALSKHTNASNGDKRALPGVKRRSVRVKVLRDEGEGTLRVKRCGQCDKTSAKLVNCHFLQLLTARTLLTMYIITHDSNHVAPKTECATLYSLLATISRDVHTVHVAQSVSGTTRFYRMKCTE